MKNVGIILSGCGVFDGSEIHEAVLTMLSLEQAGAHYQCFAPNIPQRHTINHLTGEEISKDDRNVLIEAARIARGNIVDIKEADPDTLDALIFPGGFGVAKNLTDYVNAGVNFSIDEDTRRLVEAMRCRQKPIGLVCIAPILGPKLCVDKPIVTIGSDPETAMHIKVMGGIHENCPVHDVVIDTNNRIISTPAYMLAENISQVAVGIDKLVRTLLDMV